MGAPPSRACSRRVAEPCRSVLWPGARIALGILLLLLGPIVQGSAHDSPTTVVDEAIQTLRQALGADEDGLRAQPCRLYGLLGRTVDPYVDFPRIARLVLGRYRRTASSLQQERFAGQFRAWLLGLSTKALGNVVLGRGLLDHLSISYRKARLSSGGTKAEVPATLSLARVLSFDMGFRLHRNSGRWLIYDIRAEGFSLVSTYRMVFAERIHESDLDDAIGWLRARNARLAQGFAHGPQDCQ